MAEISKVRLPSGNTYDIKDAVAREMISGGVSFIIAWNGASEPVVANIPAGVIVKYNETSYTGTLSAASATAGAFYLISSSTSTSGSPKDVYDEYVVIKPDTSDSSTWFWEKIGDTQVDLSDVVTNVKFNPETADVLGKGTTFTLSSGTVTHGALTGHTDEVLGSGTTFTVTNPTITVTPTTTNIKATASGGTVGADGTAAAITGFGTHSTDTFVKSVTAETNKNLVTTSIVPTNGTESVSKVTKTASKLVTTSVPNVTGNTSVLIPNVTSVGSASTWSFTMGSGDDSETLIIGGANGTAPSLGTSITATNTTLGTAITAATGSVASNGTGSDIVTAVTITDKDVAKVGTAVTVATGATSESGTGDAVVTGVTVGASGSAITALGTPTTANVLTGVKVTKQPTVALATGATAGTGVISVATGITSANATGGAVTASGDMINAVVSMPTSTVGTGITVGTNDKVTALTNATDITVTKGKQ